MIKRTEAKDIYDKSIIEIKQKELDENLKLIRETTEWCDTVLSKLIKENAQKGYNKLSLSIACCLNKCYYVNRAKNQRVRLHFDTLAQIIANSGFTSNAKKIANSIHWQSLTIEW